MDGDRLAEQLKGRDSQMDGDSRWRNKDGRAGPRSLRGCLVFGKKDGRLSVQQSPGWLTTGKLSQGRELCCSPSCSLSTELGVPQISAVQRPQILGQCPVFGPGLRESAAPIPGPDAPSFP